MTLHARVEIPAEAVAVLQRIRDRAGLRKNVSDEEIFHRTYCSYYDRSLSDPEAKEAADRYYRHFLTGGKLELFVLRYADSDIVIPEKLKG